MSLAAGMSVPVLGKANSAPDAAACVTMARESRALETKQLLALLARPPEDVLARDGKAAIEQVREYLKLKEMVLFRCPIGVENGALANVRSNELPPLPAKGPPRPKVDPPVKQAPVVPLPVKRTGTFKFPEASQG